MEQNQFSEEMKQGDFDDNFVIASADKSNSNIDSNNLSMAPETTQFMIKNYYKDGPDA